MSLVKPADVLVEDAEIMFRNFSGKADAYTVEGQRSFAIALTEESAENLSTDGWNVNRLKPREDSDDYPDGRPFIKVKVNFKERPPKCVQLTSNGSKILTAETVGLLDSVDIKKVDLIITPYLWDVNGKEGITAYLKCIYVTINEDILEERYGV